MSIVNPNKYAFKLIIWRGLYKGEQCSLSLYRSSEINITTNKYSYLVEMRSEVDDHIYHLSDKDLTWWLCRCLFDLHSIHPSYPVEGPSIPTDILTMLLSDKEFQ